MHTRHARPAATAVVLLLGTIAGAGAAEDAVGREGPGTARPAGEFVFERAPFESCHASTVVQTADGGLLCAFFAG
jgi:hypothetical protein